MIRKLSRLIATLLALGLLAIAALLITSHWQIRQVEPALPTAAEIEAALPEESAAATISYVNTATQNGPFGKLGHVGVLIEWPDRAAFLLDTGMPPAQAIAFGAPMERFLKADPTQTFGSVVSQMGAAVQSIGGIAFTHLHTDHTDGIGGICNAQANPATVFQTGLQREQQNYGTSPGEKNIATAICRRLTLGPDTVKQVPGFPGIVAIAAGGHTPGSTLFASRFNGKVWIFAGDITNDMHSLHNNIDKHWAYTAFIVPESPARQRQLRLWLESLDQRADFQVLVAHDIEAWKQSEITAWRARDIQP